MAGTRPKDRTTLTVGPAELDILHSVLNERVEYLSTYAADWTKALEDEFQTGAQLLRRVGAARQRLELKAGNGTGREGRGEAAR